MEFRAFSNKLNRMFNHSQITFWNNKETLNARCGASASCECYDVDCVLSRFTGFRDSLGLKIFEGDILSDEVETDEGVVTSKLQVFFNDKIGAWCLDTSFNQDKSHYSYLYEELDAFEYKINGNIYRK